MKHSLTLVILQKTPGGEIEVLVGMDGPNMTLIEIIVPENVTVKELANQAPQELGFRKNLEHKMIGIYDDPNDRPREKIGVTVAYVYQKSPEPENLKHPAYSFFAWIALDQLRKNKMIRDHSKILEDSLKTTAEWCEKNRDNGHILLGDKFKLTDLFRIRKKLGSNEKAVGNFTRDILKEGQLRALKKDRTQTKGRPGVLYSLKG